MQLVCVSVITLNSNSVLHCALCLHLLPPWYLHAFILLSDLSFTDIQKNFVVYSGSSFSSLHIQLTCQKKGLNNDVEAEDVCLVSYAQYRKGWRCRGNMERNLWQVGVPPEGEMKVSLWNQKKPQRNWPFKTVFDDFRIHWKFISRCCKIVVWIVSSYSEPNCSIPS